MSAFYRVATATVVLALPFARRVGSGQVAARTGTIVLAVVAGVFFTLDLDVWNTAVFMTNSASVTLFANDAPVIVGLEALLLFHERLQRPSWIGLALALVGIVVIGGDVLTPSRLGAGDILALLSGAFYASYLLVTQRIRARLDTLSSLWIGGAVSAALLLALNVALHRALWSFPTGAYLALLGLGLISQVMAWLAINYALGRLPAAIVSVTLLEQPILTAMLAIPLRGESLDVRQIIGRVIALAGIYLVNHGIA